MYLEEAGVVGDLLEAGEAGEGQAVGALVARLPAQFYVYKCVKS